MDKAYIWNIKRIINNKSFIVKYNTHLLYIGCLLYGLLIILRNNSITLTTLLCVFTFISYMLLLISCSNKNKDFYNVRNLAITVFVYSLIFVSFFLLFSYYEDGDTFLFSKVDAKIYEKGSLRMADMPIEQTFSYVNKHYQYDDWGAFFMMSTILRITPSKLFLNFVYIIFGTITATSIFKLGRVIMSSRYSYLAALSYAVSSFSLYFYGTFLKESFFILLVVESFYFFYKYVQNKDLFNLLWSLLFSLSLLFFRPAVMLFLWFSYLFYFLKSRAFRIPKIIKYLLFFILLLLISSYVSVLFNQYTANGDIETVVASRGSEEKGVSASPFMYMVVTLGTLIGPYPTLISVGNENPRSALYGIGLLYKIFLSFPFWLGIYYAIKKRVGKVYPLFIFVLIESIPLIMIQVGLELRKGLPHCFVFYLMAFWCLDRISNINAKKMYKKIYPLYYAFIFFLVLGWNIIR